MNIHKNLTIALIALSYTIAFIALQSTEFFLAPFRESQTAISIYYLINNFSSILNYQTPIFGYPWLVPFEFPLYQFIVSLFSTQDPDSIRLVGRLLSFVFFFFSIFYVWKYIFKYLGFTKYDRYFLYLFIFSSPIYFNFSFAVMIESFVFLNSSIFLLLSIRYIYDKKIKFLFYASLFSTIAAIVKITTWFVFGTFAGIFLIGSVFYKNFNITKALLAIFLIVFVPLFFGIYWTDYSDNIKDLNVLTSKLTSSAVQEWTIGNFKQKLSLTSWILVLLKLFILVFGISIFLLIPFLVKNSSIKNLDRKLILIAVSSFITVLFSLIIFLNLYLSHDYYFYANGIFLIIFIYCFIKQSRYSPNSKKLLHLCVFISLISSNIYFHAKKSYEVPSDANAVYLLQNLNNKGGVVIFGHSYSSVIPFESKRKALMLDNNYKSEDLNYIANLNSHISWSAFIINHPKYENDAQLFMNMIGFEGNFKYQYSHLGVLYTSKEINDAHTLVSYQAIVDSASKLFKHSDNLRNGYLKFSFYEDNNFFQLGYCRGSTLFMLKLFPIKIYRIDNYCTSSSDSMDSN